MDSENNDFNLGGYLSKDELKSLAKSSKISITKHDTKEKISEKILNSEYGFLSFISKSQSIDDIKKLSSNHVIEIDDFWVVRSDNKIDDLDINLCYYRAGNGYIGNVEEPLTIEIIQTTKKEENADKIKKILSRLMTVSGRSICYHGSRNTDIVNHSAYDEELSVYLYGTKISGSVKSAYSKPSINGVPIIDTNVIIPSIKNLVDNEYFIEFTDEEEIYFYWNKDFSEVFIPFDVFATDIRDNDEVFNQYDLFEKIINDISDIYMRFNSDLKDEFLTEYNKKMKDIEKIYDKNVDNLFSGLYEKTKKAYAENLKKSVDESKKNVDWIREQYALELKKLQSIEFNLLGITSISQDEEQKKLLNDLVLLRKNKLIKRLYMYDDNHLNVDTEMIYVKESNGKVRLIGEFTISIKLLLDPIENINDLNTSDLFTFKNKTVLVDGYQSRMHSPHIFTNSTACFGNITHDLLDYLMKFQYRAIIELLINFLRSANVLDTAGKHITNWPEVAEIGSLDVISYTADKTNWLDDDFFKNHVDNLG